jgi:hypothetical protein
MENVLLFEPARPKRPGLRKEGLLALVREEC